MYHTFFLTATLFVVYFDILQVAKWPHLQLFYELFADHPTLGFSFSVDTSPESSAVVVEVAATQVSLEPALAATAVTPPVVATVTATAVTQPGVAAASAASLVDDWISSSESDSDDIQVGAKRPPTPATPIGRPPAKRAFKTPDEAAASSSHSAARGASAKARQGSAMDKFLDIYASTSKAKMEDANMRAERTIQHDREMAERSEKHSTMLQTQLVDTTAKLQENQQTFLTNNLKAIMSFQAELIKGVLEK